MSNMIAVYFAAVYLYWSRAGLSPAEAVKEARAIWKELLTQEGQS